MEQNSEFSGWAKVELMGRNVLVGYVTTRYSVSPYVPDGHIVPDPDWSYRDRQTD